MRRIVAFLLVLLALDDPAAVRAAEGPELAIQVKAAFLYNFLKFAEWPARDPAPLRMTIGVYGDEALAATARDLLRDKEARGLPVRVLSFSDSGEVRFGDNVLHLLFLGAVPAAERDRVLAALRDRPVLTVGESPGFCEAGGIINLVREGERLRFEVNVPAAQRGGLTLSSKLLALARRVFAGEGPRP